MIQISNEQLQIVSNLTLQLVKLRQNECKHLSIENSAPEIFRNLLLIAHNDYDLVEIDPIGRPVEGQ